MYVTETSIRAWEERRAQAVAQAETPDEVYAAEVARFLADMRKRLGWRSGPTAETKARIAALVASCDAA
jgi:hypothetical protein